MGKKVTTQDFIQNARKVHGDLYDYSSTEYKSAKEKVTIIDPIHGPFQQAPTNHLSGNGHPARRDAGNAKRFKKTSDQFIRDARQIHLDHYDYSKVEYKNSHTKVTVICPTHGDFKIAPNRHLAGAGCQKCSGRHRYTTDEWIEEARKVHGDTYDYTKVKYVNAHKPVIIIDPVHGRFSQSPTNHLGGAGSPYRANNQALNTEEFIRRAKKIHGDIYDYSKVEYTNTKEKVLIIDPDFGEFEQIAITHLKGRQSPWRAGNMPYTTESFIEKATQVHSGLYDYSKVVYKNYTSKVTIIDPEFGEFEQIAGMHLQGQGCPQRSANYRDTKESFIAKARIIHGELYDYSQSEYVNNLTPIKIIDPDYGEFHKSPSNHLRGQGHPKRSKGGFDPSAPAILYYLKVAGGRAYKVGITNRTVEERFGSDIALIEIIKVWRFDQGRDAEIKESEILKEYAHSQYVGEPILSNGNSELFSVDVLSLDSESSIQITENIKQQSPPKKRRLIIKRYTTETWKAAATEIHQDLYDYSKVEYVSASKKVLIIDPEHGEFWQNPSKHLGGAGCPKRARSAITWSLSEFIERANKIHSGFYDYSKVNYENQRTKVLIIDPELGEFWQTPEKHLMGRGHPKRRGKKPSKSALF